MGTITGFHLVLSSAGTMIAVLGIVWGTFIRPAHIKEIKLQVRLAQMEGRLDEGDKEFERHRERDDRLEQKIDTLIESVNQLKQQFAGVAPAMQRELGQ